MNDHGPHEANLRGELAPEQIRSLHACTWRGLQEDIARGRVKELSHAEVIPIDDALDESGAAYGVRVSPSASPAPVAPHLVALPGRYRAWVLPVSGIAVALEPLDDEADYLRAHRAHILELQGLDDDDLIPLEEALRPPGILRRFMHRLEPRVAEGALEDKTWRNTVKIGDANLGPLAPIVVARLVVGVRYRVRPDRSGRRVIEPIAPEITTTGPYR